MTYICPMDSRTESDSLQRGQGFISQNADQCRRSAIFLLFLARMQRLERIKRVQHTVPIRPAKVPNLMVTATTTTKNTIGIWTLWNYVEIGYFISPHTQ